MVLHYNKNTKYKLKKIQSDQRCYGFETTPPCRPCIISNAGYLLITRYLFSNNRLLHFQEQQKTELYQYGLMDSMFRCSVTLKLVNIHFKPMVTKVFNILKTEHFFTSLEIAFKMEDHLEKGKNTNLRIIIFLVYGGMYEI